MRNRKSIKLLACVAAALAALMGQASAAELSARQSQLLANNCLQCHARLGVGAPQVGDVQAWKPYVAKGEPAMLASAVQGTGGMPPLGYCSACTEDDFRALIRFMAKLAPPATASGNAQGAAK
ncbi:c-type cytochrome [Duganella sp. LX20W]|uniref:C-type cytochrome n=1 Tax=Rugamonas brunnea TaxID=2758569 RepID=A0A7W2EP45_9BURK|nr:c-type cytochrome [Rugamonas brunnea]MBA5636006.1 c-type cytochrome [Rugamonas brunnea]